MSSFSFYFRYGFTNFLHFFVSKIIILGTITLIATWYYIIFCMSFSIINSISTNSMSIATIGTWLC